MDLRYIIALEFSGSQVKGAMASVNSSPFAPMSIPTIESVVHEDNTMCVQYGRVKNIIDASNNASFIIQKLENDPKIQRGHIISAYVGLSGRSLASVKTSAELTLPQEQQITEDMLARLQREATKGISGEKEVLAVLPRKHMVDNQATQNPVGAIGKHIKGEFTVITCSTNNKRNLEMVLNDKIKLPVNEYVITPLAIANLVLSAEEKQLGCVLVDMGAQTTTVMIYKDKALQYIATLPLGSQHITMDISTGLNLTPEKAEQAKQQQGNATPEPSGATDSVARLNCYVQARAGEIIANIIAQLGYAGFKASDLTAGFIVTGRGSKLKNFDKALESNSKMKVRRASIPSTVNVADSSIDPTDYTSIIAVAVHGTQANNHAGCVQFPEVQPMQQPKPVMEFPISANPCDNDIPDDDWNKDTDDIIAKNEKREKAKKKEEDEAKAKAKKTEQNNSVLEKMRSKILDLFFTPSGDDDDDADLDEKA